MLVVVVAAAARAHPADLLSLVVVEQPSGGLETSVVLTAETLGLLAPVDADRDGLLTAAELAQAGPAIAAGVWGAVRLARGGACALRNPTGSLRESVVELRARFECPGRGELQIDVRALSVLPVTYSAEVAVALRGVPPQALTLQAPRTSGTVSAPAALAPGGGTWRWLVGGGAAVLVLALLLSRWLSGRSSALRDGQRELRRPDPPAR